MSNTKKPTFATVWLDGCSGCHMSFIDLDERLLDLADQVDILISPLVDRKDYPDFVDIALVEGAVSSDEDEHKIKHIRAHTGTLIAFGDCAVSANVPAMRNQFKLKDIYDRAYVETADVQPQHPLEVVPRLLPRVRPIQEVVPVDVYLQGCPPPADVIYYALTELLAGRTPDFTGRTRPGK